MSTRKQHDPDEETAISEHTARASELAAERSQFPVTLAWTDTKGSHETTVSQRVTLGSSNSVDVIIADPTVSRIHADLELRADGVWVRDLGSKNGTSVDHVFVRAARLPANTSLRLGSTIIAVQHGREATSVSLWPSETFGPLVGGSTAMREMFAQLAKISPKESTVLIQGETGTGKELVANAIHAGSSRSKSPMIVVDCAALPENLLEAELFGYSRGAFTGAAASHEGAIEAAEGGTVFLDEIGELPLSMQPKLLRALESRSVRRLGETQSRSVNVRFISATHRDLREMVNDGSFREDLYFRLAVLAVEVPPLRARQDDIARLVRYFASADSRESITAEVIADLEKRPWHGNVRELRNFVERVAAVGAEDAYTMTEKLSRGAKPRVAPVVPVQGLNQPFKAIRDQVIEDLEREYLRGQLEAHKRNINAVAEASGFDVTWVRRLVKKYQL